MGSTQEILKRCQPFDINVKLVRSEFFCVSDSAGPQYPLNQNTILIRNEKYTCRFWTDKNSISEPPVVDDT